MKAVVFQSTVCDVQVTVVLSKCTKSDDVVYKTSMRNGQENLKSTKPVVTSTTVSRECANNIYKQCIADKMEVLYTIQ